MPDGDVKDSVEFKGLGVELQATGQRVIAVVLGVGVALVVGYAAYIHHTQMEQDDRAILDQLNELVYVLALPQADREKLQLSMPDSLRAKIRRHRADDPS